MDEKSLKEVIEFCKIVGKLKKVERTGWVTAIGIENPESVAEHTYMTAVTAMLIGDLKKLDTEKMIRMALLHDLAEVLTGDWDQFAKKKLGMDLLNKKEKSAIEMIIKELPENLRPEYSKIWDELIKQKTEEAKLVMETDKLELMFQTLEYEKEGVDRKKLERFWKYAEDRIIDKDLKKIFELTKKMRDDGRK